MKVGFATADWALSALDRRGHPTLGGSGHYRSGLPAAWTRENTGAEVVVGRLFANRSSGRFGVMEWNETPHHDVDVLVMQRWMNDDIAERIRLARSRGQVVVNDVDDNWLALHPRNHAFDATDVGRDPTNNRRHYVKAVEASTRVSVSTPFLLRQWARRVGDRAVLSRNWLDPDAFPWRTQAERPTFGWVGAIPWHPGDPETMKGVLAPVLRSAKLPFRHEGAVDGVGVADRMGLGGVEFSAGPMRSIYDYPQMFRSFDVGVVPLEASSFNEAKSALKGMEYAASGIPFVASATEEYRRLASLGCGRVASRPRDWRRHLEALARASAEERTAEAEANYAALLALPEQVERGQTLFSALTRPVLAGTF